MESPLDKKIIYGLIGYPLVHSFSHDFFNQKFIAEDINALYINFEIEDLGLLMEVIAEYPEVVDAARKAIQAVGLTPFSRPVRGGTDGAQL